MKRFFQFIWLLPVTILVWLFYIIPFWLFRHIKFMKMVEPLICEFQLIETKNGSWYQKLWTDFSGSALPCAYIVKEEFDVDRARRTKLHELEHCKQQFRWGIFFYPVYVGLSLWIWLFMKDDNFYYDNPFEVSARQAASQQVYIPKEQWANGSKDRFLWW